MHPLQATDRFEGHAAYISVAANGRRQWELRVHHNLLYTITVKETLLKWPRA